MLVLADRFEILDFYKEIVEFVNTGYNMNRLSDDNAIDLLITIDKIQLQNVEVYKKLIKRLSRGLFFVILLKLYGLGTVEFCA